MLRMPDRILQLSAAACLVTAIGPAHADILVASFYSNAVLRFTDSGDFVEALGQADSSPPIGITVHPDGTIYAAFAYATHLSKYDAASQLFVPFTSGGSLSNPHQITFGGPANDLYAADLGAWGMPGGVNRFSGATGVFLQPISLPSDVHSGITGIAVDPSGTVFMAGRANTSIYRYTAAGLVLLTTTGLPLDGLTLGPDGKLYVGAAYGNVVLRFNLDGTPFGANGSPTDPTFISDPANLNLPFHVAFGSDGLLYVANQGSDVVRYTPAGRFVDTFIPAGAGGMNGPCYLAFTSTPDRTGYASAVTQELIASVAELVSSGVLTTSHAIPLVRRLEVIEAKLDRGRPQAAVALLNAFIRQVNAMIRSGRLSADQGQSLILGAQGAVESLR